MRLAANLTLLYADLPVAERFSAAVRDGFSHIEILAPYDQSPDWYADQLTRHGLKLVLINTPVVSADYPLGTAAQPGARDLFRQSMAQAAAVCRATGCRAVHVMAGLRVAGTPRYEQSQTLRDNLRWASQEYPDLLLQLEALNTTDVPSYFYSVPDQVADELDAIDSPRVGMQFDFYHVVREGLSPAGQVTRHYLRIRHVQIAGAPDRHEPDLDQDGLMDGIRSLNELGYRGFMGLEYRPADQVGSGLSWVQPLLDHNLITCRRTTK